MVLSVGQRWKMAARPDEELRARMERAKEIELLKMVTVEARDYLDDVLDAARAELRRRGKDVPTTKAFLRSLTREELDDHHLFCVDCYKATTRDEFPATGETFFRRLLPGTDACPRCGAVVREHSFAIAWMPVYGIAKYRVKELEVPWPGVPKVLASRKMRDPSSRRK